MKNHDEFIACIHECRLADVSFASKSEGGAVVTRRCAPWDIGPHSKAKDASVNYYWVIDLSSPTGVVHPVCIRPENLVSVMPLNDTFEPHELATGSAGMLRFHTPRNW